MYYIFLKSYKQEHLLPTFAKVWLSNKSASFKLMQRISPIIMEDKKIKKLRKEIRSFSIKLKSCLTMLVYSVLLRRINMVVKSRKKAINYLIRKNY